MKHHYWEPPIALYLFLGGLAGGILFLSAIFNTFVVPGYGEVFAMPVFWSLVAIAIGCVFLVVDLGQPGVFWRVWTTAKSIIKWGATFLVIAAVFALLYLLAYLGDSWTFFAPLSEALKPAAGVFLIIAGFFGLCIMMYTGIMLSTLKAHAFWATRLCPCCSPSRLSRPAAPPWCFRSAVGGADHARVAHRLRGRALDPARGRHHLGRHRDHRPHDHGPVLPGRRQRDGEGRREALGQGLLRSRVLDRHRRLRPGASVHPVRGRSWRGFRGRRSRARAHRRLHPALPGRQHRRPCADPPARFATTSAWRSPTRSSCRSGPTARTSTRDDVFARLTGLLGPRSRSGEGLRTSKRIVSLRPFSNAAGDGFRVRARPS